ncbi:hypothetical protein [uncultured Campylobacter sp.]|uniref:hypothetical protein n=1 Tax=uncultured Campylobacter sp. TaxID=218934 RepID=UPI00261CDCE0|nr:hypothetical protein [uncultured Campylobacter sp.]
MKFQNGTRGMGIKNLRSRNRRKACFLAVRSEISKQTSGTRILKFCAEHRERSKATDSGKF